jgi:2-polyprenyl-3-methyl-5-hydroxy-6-metoxy-1,4-benzoquinol methylase
MSNFNSRAKEWDQQDRRVNGAKIIADAIEKRITFTKEMQIIDFGVGTGLLGFEIAQKVKQVYGVDTSIGMLEKLKEKNSDNINIIPIHQDIIQKPLMQKFDGLISSMTLHHVKEIEAFFKIIYTNIKDDGFIALADLEKENGTFHSNNSDVHHFGFDADELYHLVKQAGFKNISIENINTISKPHGDFGVFLLTAQR